MSAGSLCGGAGGWTAGRQSAIMNLTTPIGVQRVISNAKGAMHMKIRRVLAALLALLLLAATAATAEEGLDFDFDEDGYTGTWVSVEALNLEFCLPDGWSQADAGEDTFAAQKDDGTASLQIYVAAEEVDDLVEWGDEVLEDYQIDTSGFVDTLYIEVDETVAVYRLNDDGKLVAFVFDRQTVDDLPTAFALQIVTSASEAWME